MLLDNNLEACRHILLCILFIFPLFSKRLKWQRPKLTQSVYFYIYLSTTFRKKYMSLLSQGLDILLWRSGLFSETGWSSIKALVLVLLFYLSSSDSPPFQLFGSLPGNPNSPTSESRRKARAKYRNYCVSFLPPMPVTLLPPSRAPPIMRPYLSSLIYRWYQNAWFCPSVRALPFHTIFLPYRFKGKQSGHLHPQKHSD